VLAHRGAREGKERGMRQRRLKAYWKRLAALQKQECARDGLLKKLGAAQDRAGRVATGLVHAEVSAEGRLSYQLDRAALRAVRQREAGICCARYDGRRSRPDLALLYATVPRRRSVSHPQGGISACAPSFIKNPSASKHTCSSPFSLTAS